MKTLQKALDSRNLPSLFAVLNPLGQPKLDLKGVSIEGKSPLYYVYQRMIISVQEGSSLDEYSPIIEALKQAGAQFTKEECAEIYPNNDQDDVFKELLAENARIMRGAEDGSRSERYLEAGTPRQEDQDDSVILRDGFESETRKRRQKYFEDLAQAEKEAAATERRIQEEETKFQRSDNPLRMQLEIGLRQENELLRHLTTLKFDVEAQLIDFKIAIAEKRGVGVLPTPGGADDEKLQDLNDKVRALDKAIDEKKIIIFENKEKLLQLKNNTLPQTEVDQLQASLSTEREARAQLEKNLAAVRKSLGNDQLFNGMIKTAEGISLQRALDDLIERRAKELAEGIAKTNLEPQKQLKNAEDALRLARNGKEKARTPGTPKDQKDKAERHFQEAFRRADNLRRSHICKPGETLPGHCSLASKKVQEYIARDVLYRAARDNRVRANAFNGEVKFNKDSYRKLSELLKNTLNKYAKENPTTSNLTLFHICSIRRQLAEWVSKHITYKFRGYAYQDIKNENPEISLEEMIRSALKVAPPRPRTPELREERQPSAAYRGPRYHQ